MKKIKDITREYVAQVKQAGIPVAEAYLYGSYAKGNAGKDSDIDICIVSPVFGKDYFSEMLKLTKIRRAVDERIEPVPFTSLDLKDKYSSLAQEIRSFGIKIDF